MCIRDRSQAESQNQTGQADRQREKPDGQAGKRLRYMKTKPTPPTAESETGGQDQKNRYCRLCRMTPGASHSAP
eukprot:9614870-Heterocapsa_arctica.AAC.1